ncbi:peptidoglycan-binding protein LysM [Ensifer sp. ENS07]|jgi:nucleoid-associated protein YgaU|uniref:Peptidoglycan-binding protein LysM n=1 Tax=Ensifer adhaerens TaxID=106592 RepID=A0A9Q8Y8H0_ENSAD|nr:MULTISPECIES: peptidoglycan-binding protein LysM [Ensifer]KSV65499.1 peptidoglycan-binding protein LysM [Sinorhizobium sp. GW3]KSV70389.1 peptidoglycan-binding protein LysM [Sinorhizobium sp. GL2]OWZ89664.1 peptidoglycan-binding protein LysM [Sinorhizobium sp. LM21]ANK74334.1 peptidoglycan-binding protein LysM [Ensifer adhaerens]KDP71641.1 peptidoglycan-binding protein LysM [Ensifer adhaerens]
MGLFSFIKNAGKKLGIGGDDDAPDAESVQKELASHDLGTKDVQVEVAGDKVVLKGVVKDQSVFEKAVVAVGNTLGVSAVEASELKVADAGAAPAPAKEPVFYTVKKGDNLWKIAEAQYGKGKGAKHTVIFEANKPMLTHPDKIYPGQVLRIPDLDAA